MMIYLANQGSLQCGECPKPLQPEVKWTFYNPESDFQQTNTAECFHDEDHDNDGNSMTIRSRNGLNDDDCSLVEKQEGMESVN